ncbi:hypothetical protein [Nostoc sp. CMAA1605]|uniref:hypothetical protein n=1 Tax=Nostoc sp. CMAA1605 TaxID=2055159 RepID=UPI001F300B97|nr:hypothetical protein [Nostoc sp. CMAA1605]
MRQGGRVQGAGGEKLIPSYLFNAPCPIPYAQCPMPHLFSQHSVRVSFKIIS